MTINLRQECDAGAETVNPLSTVNFEAQFIAVRIRRACICRSCMSELDGIRDVRMFGCTIYRRNVVLQ